MFNINQIIKEVALETQSVKDGIACFIVKTQAEIERDKYENVAENIDFYTWLAYSNLDTQIDSKPIYSRISTIVTQHLKSASDAIVLDVGCGVGRTLYDLSNKFESNQFVGIDYSLNMLKRVKQILLSNKELQLDLSTSGLPPFKLEVKSQSNLHLLQASVMELPIKPNSADVVINTFLIDRVPDVRLAIEQMITVLKPRGLFVLSSPLNFQTTKDWEFGNPDTLIMLLTELGIENIQSEDNIEHKEVLDVRGNTKTWNTLIIWGRKKEG